MDKDDDARKTYRTLFLEIAIVEHLARSRMERLDGSELTIQQFGILNYFMRQNLDTDGEATIAWSFQDDEAYMSQKIDDLASLGLTSVSGDAPDRQVTISETGKSAHRRALEVIQREIGPLTEGIDLDDVKVALRVLQELRRTLDNLPDR